MSDKKEYLNEEWYQKVKKKITRISLIILIVSIVIGGGLIATGIIKTDSYKKEAAKINEERYNAAYKESEEKVAAAKQRLSDIATEKEALNKQYDSKNQECDSLNMRDSDWYTKVNQCHREASAIKSKINDLESEEFKLNNANYTVYYDKAIAKNYIFLSIIGGIVIFIGGMTALMVYVIAKKREIRAFGIQQSMPVTQEAIDKMAPTVGNAAGTISKGISKGIKDGLKGDDNK
jgi:flagellar basal body-associated protein FliL